MIINKHMFFGEVEPGSSSVKQYDSGQDEGPAVALLPAPWLQQPAAEGAAESTNSSMQGMGGVVHDGCQFGQHPPLTHLLNGLEGTVQDRAGLPDQPVQSLPVSFSATTAPADHCIQQCGCHHSVIKSSEQGPAHPKGENFWRWQVSVL